MSAHLGSWVSALVDGQLDGTARERAFSHLAWCEQCADEVSAARSARRTLSRELADVAPAPDFMNRLLALSVPEGSAATSQPSPAPAQAGAAQVPSAEPASPFAEHTLLPPRWQALCGDVPSARTGRWRRVAVAGALVVSVSATGLFALGSSPAVAPNRHAADALAALASSNRTGDDAAGLSASAPLLVSSGGQAPAASDGFGHEVLDWMRTEGWPRPDSLPFDTEVTALRFTGTDRQVLEVDLTSPVGDVVLREQRGQLDLAATADLAHVTVRGAPVYVVSEEPVHLVWQSDDTVIDLVTQASVDDVLHLVSTFAVDEFDTGFQARVGRGWSTLTGVLS